MLSCDFIFIIGVPVLFGVNREHIGDSILQRANPDQIKDRTLFECIFLKLTENDLN